MAGIIANISELITLFTHVATSNPGSALLMLFGAIFVGVSVLFFAYLTIGGIFGAIAPDTSGRPRQS